MFPEELNRNQDFYNTSITSSKMYLRKAEGKPNYSQKEGNRAQSPNEPDGKLGTKSFRDLKLSPKTKGKHDRNE